MVVSELWIMDICVFHLIICHSLSDFYLKVIYDVK